MRTIVFATGNTGKMREIREILKGMEAEILSMKEIGIDADIEENGTTFEENALIKVKAVARILENHTDEKLRSAIVLADDSGLEIDYLNKEPGIYSARYMGEDTPYSVKNKNLIERLVGVPDEKRTARFVCAIAAALPGDEAFAVRGVIEGRIGYQEKGDNGFGYDPIFYVPEYGCTTAQLSEEEKNRVSHRGKALKAMEKELEKRISFI
ncbi:MAG: XTP/dITP diphosphatase [Lachnospiraceae bacterium]|nr:XTP/dITP diphosphatase [Lachnospiraceae bacterium]